MEIGLGKILDRRFNADELKTLRDAKIDVDGLYSAMDDSPSRNALKVNVQRGERLCALALAGTSFFIDKALVLMPLQLARWRLCMHRSSRRFTMATQT